MADLARALQTPVPGQQPAASPQQQPATTSRTPAGPEPRPLGIQQEDVRVANKAKKNERDRLRRKAQRAAALQAAEMPKKKKRKAKKKVTAAPAVPAKRGRGRPPGSKNKRGRPPGTKNRPPLMDTVFPKAVIPASKDLLTQIGLAVTLLNAMPEHARKVVLDAVK